MSKAPPAWLPFATRQLKRAGRAPRQKRAALAAAGRAYRSLRRNPTVPSGVAKVPWGTVAGAGVIGVAAYKLLPRLLGKKCSCSDSHAEPAVAAATPPRSKSGL